MSAPRYMMETEFEPEGYDYEDYGDYEDYEDYEYYGDYERECMVCAGYSYIKKIYITPKKYNDIYIDIQKKLYVKLRE